MRDETAIIPSPVEQEEGYHPRTGDRYIQEVRAGRFNVHHYDEEGYGWGQLHSCISEQEAQAIVAPPYALVGKSKGKGKRQYYRLECIPQFPDGSGWDVEDEQCPYFYEHISLQEAAAQTAAWAEQLYKIVHIILYPDQPHKDTYFVKGAFLAEFLYDLSEEGNDLEYIVSIEPVQSMPSTDEKLP